MIEQAGNVNMGNFVLVLVQGCEAMRDYKQIESNRKYPNACKQAHIKRPTAILQYASGSATNFITCPVYVRETPFLHSWC